MAKCEICGKTAQRGNQISIARSHVSRRAKRDFKPNLRTTRINVNGENKKITVCAKCLRAAKAAK